MKSLMAKSAEIGNLLQREQLFVFSGLALITVFAWAYMLHMAWEMLGKGMYIDLACLCHWRPRDLVHTFIMWSIMMVAMMVPSATPMFIIFATVNRQRSKKQGPFIPTWLFLVGYLTAWTVYSALATMAQWGLHTAALLTHTLVITSPLLGALLLFAAGVFQWTPFRDACMTQCRSPFGFIMTEWREGHRGALIMGLKHGIYCVGCCWMLMILSFVLGVMNMLWMAALTAFMVLEKVSNNKWISRVAGMILIVWGLWVAAGAMG
jgi:predicted metal-binding membrane protein